MGADCHLDVLHEWRDVVERHLEDNRARVRVRVRARGRVRGRVRVGTSGTLRTSSMGMSWNEMRISPRTSSG